MRFINQRDQDNLSSAFMEDNYCKQFTNAWFQKAKSPGEPTEAVAPTRNPQSTCSEV